MWYTLARDTPPQEATREKERDSEMTQVLTQKRKIRSNKCDVMMAGGPALILIYNPIYLYHPPVATSAATIMTAMLTLMMIVKDNTNLLAHVVRAARQAV